MVTSQSISSRARAWFERALLLSSIVAAGYASLGTSEYCDGGTLEAKRLLAFTEADSTHLVHIRASSRDWYSLELAADQPVVLEQVLAKAEAEADAGVSSGNATSNAYGSRLSISCVGDECADGDVLVLVKRGALQGGFQTKLTATFRGSDLCVSPQTVEELRIDLGDAAP